MGTEWQSSRIRLHIDSRQIAWLRFVLESYDGLAVLRTIDPRAGEVELYVGRGVEAELAGLILSMKDRLGLVRGLGTDLYIPSADVRC